MQQRPVVELQSSMTVEQIDNILSQLETMARRKRQLIDEYNSCLESSPPRKEVKQIRPSRLSSPAYRRSPERFFWTVDGKSAIRFKTPRSKPCFICNATSNIEIVDKYSAYTCCARHGKILANRLGIRIEGMTEKEQQNEYDDMSAEEIQSLLERLYEQLERSRNAST